MTSPADTGGVAVADLDDLPVLAGLAQALLEDATGRVVLGITGAPGAGKTTLVARLLAALDRLDPHGPLGRGGGAVAHLPMDGFHLADAQLDRLGLRRYKGAPETFDVDGYAAALARVRRTTDRPVYVPGFERDLEQPLAAALVVGPQARLVVTEGNYLLLPDEGWVAVRDQLDAVWFVDDSDSPGRRRQRLVARHVRFGKTPEEAAAWVETVDEPNAQLVAGTIGHADLVLRSGAAGRPVQP